MPEVGYQEVYLARAYAKAGFEVRVFTSDIVSPSSDKIIKKNYSPGYYEDIKYNYSVVRLKSYFHFRSTVLCRGIYEKISDFNPDIIIIVGVAKLFPVSLINKKLNCKYINIFGENKEYRNREGFLNKIKSVILDTGFAIFKKRYYKKSIVVSDLIVLNVPETDDFFNKILNKKLLNIFNRKKYNLNLGYDSEEFYFDRDSRNRIRQELGATEKDFIIISTTKVTRNKKIDKIIDNLTKLINKGYNIYYIVIGLLGDNYEDELRQKIIESGYGDRFKLFRFKNHNEIRNFYCASDIGLWTQAAISIQEAMGTGLKVLLPDKKSVSHLIKSDKCGWYYKENEFTEAMETAIKFISSDTEYLNNRFDLAVYNSSFLSYDFISKKFLDRLNESE